MLSILPLGVFVGNATGEGNVEKVKRYISSAKKLCAVVCLTSGVGMYLLRRHFALMFTQDPAIVDYVSGILMICSIVFPFSNVVAILSAVARSIGKEKENMTYFVISVYIIGLPLCYFMGYPTGWGVYGMRVAYGISVVINAVLLFILMNSCNMVEQVLTICKRIREDQAANNKLIQDDPEYSLRKED